MLIFSYMREMLYSIPYRKDPAGSKPFSLQKLQTREGVRGGFSGLNKCLR